MSLLSAKALCPLVDSSPGKVGARKAGAGGAEASGRGGVLRQDGGPKPQVEEVSSSTPSSQHPVRSGQGAAIHTDPNQAAGLGAQKLFGPGGFLWFLRAIPVLFKT